PKAETFTLQAFGAFTPRKLGLVAQRTENRVGHERSVVARVLTLWVARGADFLHTDHRRLNPTAPPSWSVDAAAHRPRRARYAGGQGRPRSRARSSVISIAEHTTTETEARKVEKSQRRDLTASRYGSGMIAAMETAAPTITS